MVQETSRRLQSAALRRVRRDPEDEHGEDSEIQAARDDKGGLMPDILVTDDGPVRIMRMNRPEKKNALTLPMYTAMAEAIEDAGTARALVIAGGADAFCAGNDINDFVQ